MRSVVHIVRKGRSGLSQTQLRTVVKSHGPPHIRTMKTDLYTKSVLTVIAACLLWLAIQNTLFPRPVAAQIGAGIQKVVVAGIEAGLPVALPVNVRQVGGENVPNATLPVKVQTDIIRNPAPQR